MFEPGPHTITIVANSTFGQVATFSYNFTVPDIISKFNVQHNNILGSGILHCIYFTIEFQCIQLTEPGKTVVICKTSKSDVISECGLIGSFENSTIVSLITPEYFMGILLNCKQYQYQVFER